ncbi:hypothetical protein [Aquimarina longa]|uniref:hypothetical protein n=1 Tax=Aquimarina longa TaxID=1080221 RepID=UPI000A9073BA|nr:hypothetical protein [Aquimarina longa]
MKIIQTINKKSLFIAALSFILGTIILLSFIISQSDTVFKIGIFYVIIAAALNTFFFIELIINAIVNYQYYKENLITILLVVLNIPITIGYISIVLNNPF